jgi:hypothetical protein
MQQRRLQKLHQNEMEEKHREEERDQWFNQVRPMVKANILGGRKG